MNFKFSDMFYKGIDFGDPDVASKLMEDYAFQRLKTGPYEPMPSRGSPYNHQREIAQIFLFVDKLILIHDPGTGKSCSISNALDQFRTSLTSAMADYVDQYLMPNKVPYRKFIILVRGPNLKEEMISQIICKCTAKGIFDTKELRAAKSKIMRSKILNRTFYKYFNVTGYDTFANELKTYLSPPRQEGWSDALYQRLLGEKRSELKDLYRNCIFVCDEIHTLTTEKDRETKSRYKFINEFFHLIEDSKIILSTATPMKNRSTEFGDILNMILPLDDQVPISLLKEAFPPLVLDEEDPDLISVEKEKDKGQKEGKNKVRDPEEAKKDLLPYLRGKISYLRAMDLHVDLVDDHGEEENILEEGGFFVRQVFIQGEEHNKAYLEAKNRYVMVDGNPVLSKSDVYSKERQLANLWLPPLPGAGSNLQKLFSAYFKRKNGYEMQPGNEAFKQNYMIPKRINPDAIPRFVYISPKSVEACEIIGKSEGKCFVFSNFKDTGVGILAICLQEIYDYTYFDEKDSIFESQSIEESSFCATSTNSSASKVKIKSNFRKKPRFAILTSGSNWNGNILRNFNSYENRHGEYIKVLLAPRFGREGINTNEVFTFINFDAHWTQTNYTQAQGRVLRSDAFIWSLNDKRKEAVERGEDQDQVRLKVNVYNLAIASNPPSSSSPSLPPSLEGEEEGEETADIDETLYLVSLRKDRDIQRMMRLIKEAAIDCYIHYDRNYRETDLDYSPVCNYEKCKYSCAVINPPSSLSYTLYDQIYSKPEVTEVKRKIRLLFENYPFYTFEEIKTLISGYRDLILIKALYELITEKTPLLDKFGTNVYLKEENGTFFVDRVYSDSGVSYSLSEYVYNTPIVAENALTDVLIEKVKGEMKDAVLRNRQDQLDPKDFDILQKLIYLEEMFKRYIREGEVPPEKRPFLPLYLNRFYNFKEPEELLERQARTASIWEKKGRRPSDIDDAKIRPIAPKDQEEVEMFPGTGEQIWVQCLLTYETTAEFERYWKGEGIIRVLKESEGFWRDANPYETLVYNKLMQVEIASRTNKMEEKGFYGFVLGSGKEDLKIVEGKANKNVRNDDLRTRTKGVPASKFVKNEESLRQFNRRFGTQARTGKEVKAVLKSNGLLIYLSL